MPSSSSSSSSSSLNGTPPHGGIHLPRGFQYGEVNFDPAPPPPGDQPPAPLGILASFTGSFTGPGFNTIFRPNSVAPTTTTFHNPVTPAPPAPPNVAVLELNLTQEDLTFSAPLGNVPNRGLSKQNDIFLNGVSYLQAVNDVTNTTTGRGDGPPTGIHTETGFWLNVPQTDTNPKLGNTLVRLGSIPHGTTINAQGSPPTVVKSAPAISPRRITPFVIGNPGDLQPKASQTASDENTARLPQDLSPFVKAGTITQEILDNPVKLLTDINDQLDIVETSTFAVTTQSTTSEPGGGTANIAFLVGQGAASGGPNADAVQMDSTFWVETVQAEVTINGGYEPGSPALLLRPDFKPTQGKPAPPLPLFSVTPDEAVTAPKTLKVTYTQIQYAQMVFLNFHGLTWPHLSLATLVPTAPIVVPFTSS